MPVVVIASSTAGRYHGSQRVSGATRGALHAGSLGWSGSFVTVVGRAQLDHARQELVVRTGLWKRMRDAGMYPVVGAQTIAYRKSLELGQKYVIESRFLGLDDRAAYLEQRFVVDGEVYARAYVQGRFLYDKGGTVPMDELSRVSGMDPVHPIPEWLHDWAAQVRLPGTRTPAPSTWD